MSKKTLKRSLVLGALMAFVITGSAMAEETLSDDKQLTNGIFSHTDYSGATGNFSDEKNWVLGSNTLMITGTNGNTVASWCADYAVYADNYSFEGEEGSKLQISNNDGSALAGGGILTNGTINVDELIINVTDKAFYAAGAMDVTADKISITSTEGEAAFASDGGTLNIKATENIKIKGKENAILVGAGASVYVASADGSLADIVIEGDIGSYNVVDVKLGTAASSITGASNVYGDSGKVSLTLDDAATWNVTGDSTVTGLAGNNAVIKNATDGDVTVTVNNANANETNVVIKDSTINLTGVDLVVNSEYIEDQYHGIIKDTTIMSDGTVELHQKGKDNAIGYCSDEKIIAKEIRIISDRSNAIYTNSSDKKYLKAEKIYLESNFTAATDTIGETVCAAGVFADDGAEVTIEEFSELDVVCNSFVDNDGGYGIVSSGNSKVTITGAVNSKLTINSDGMTALGAFSNGKLTVSADTLELTTEKFRDASDARKSGTIAVQGMTYGDNYNNGASLTINVEKSLTVTDSDKRTGENATNAIKVTDGSLMVNSKANTIIDIDGNITQTAGSINLALQNDKSSVTGAINTATEKADIVFKNGAVWNNTGASKVAKLSLTDGVINQNATDAITIASYSGNGTINYGDGAGKVYIDNGSGKLTLAMDSEDDLEKIAEQLGVKDNTLGITAQIVKSEGAVTGEQITEVKYDEQETDGYYLGTIGKTTEKINTTNASINNMLNVALMAWRAENNDMNKRLGELRNANGEHGVWVRMVNGESEYKDVENEYKTYQLGYDEKLSVDPSWTVGAAVSYTEADTTADKASGENKHKGFSVYGSKLNDDGSFVDLIAKVARIEHDFNVAGDKGDWSSNGYSLSAEYGKRLEQGNGLWIEPQVELTYGKISSAECELAGRNVTLEDMESLVGRVGFSLGKDIKQGNIYARASYLYDFEGETTTKFSDGKDTRSFEQDLGGGWWEVGVGANINLSKATYIYADVEKTFGGEVDTNWQWNLGVRYSF